MTTKKQARKLKHYKASSETLRLTTPKGMTVSIFEELPPRRHRVCFQFSMDGMESTFEVCIDKLDATFMMERLAWVLEDMNNRSGHR